MQISTKLAGFTYCYSASERAGGKGIALHIHNIPGFSNFSLQSPKVAITSDGSIRKLHGAQTPPLDTSALWTDRPAPPLPSFAAASHKCVHHNGSPWA